MVSLRDPNRLAGAGVYELVREQDREKVLRSLLSEDDFEVLWSEFGNRPALETEALLDDVFEYYGAGRERTAELAFLIDRYGEAIHFDLRALWAVDLVEYFDGSRRPVELWEFVERLPRNSRYWAARSQDTELYKAARAAGMRSRKAPPPEAYEYSPELECLAAVFYQLQQIGYLIANQNVKRGRRKRFKGVAWPVPVTAADMVKRQEARAAFEIVESAVRFVPVEEYEALTRADALADGG